MLSNKAALAAIGVVALVGASAAGAFLASVDEPAPMTAGPKRHSRASRPPRPSSTIRRPRRRSTPAAAAGAAPRLRPAPAPAKPAAAARDPEPPRRPRAPASERDSAGLARSQAQSQQAPASPAPRPVDHRNAWSAGPPTTERPVETVPVTDVPVAREDRRPAGRRAARRRCRNSRKSLSPPTRSSDCSSSRACRATPRVIEDRVEARVTRDVRADGRVAIPAGSRVLGSVSVVERGGKMRERARLGVRFHTVILADGTELALQTETVLREGESPGNASAAKVGGGAIGGAILGAILGGGKGAAIGAGVGAGAGTAAVMAGGRRAATDSSRLADDGQSALAGRRCRWRSRHAEPGLQPAHSLVEAPSCAGFPSSLCVGSEAPCGTASLLISRSRSSRRQRPARHQELHAFLDDGVIDPAESAAQRRLRDATI